MFWGQQKEGSGPELRDRPVALSGQPVEPGRGLSAVSQAGGGQAGVGTDVQSPGGSVLGWVLEAADREDGRVEAEEVGGSPRGQEVTPGMVGLRRMEAGTWNQRAGLKVGSGGRASGG